MFAETLLQHMAPSKERPKFERRQATRREEDKLGEQAQQERARKLHSLLELGQIIGLDLQLHDMLLQIAQKACEVMEADRCTLFLHDSNTDELWSTVALGMRGQVIRMPSNVGMAGHSFQTGESVNLEDAYKDPRFNRDVDAHTGYHTRALLCVPLYNRAGLRVGAIQLLNKKDGVFSKEDEAFLKTFGNHVSVFIEIAQLQKARIDALEESRKELERLNRAKSKALDHLSHELRTPLAVIQGNIRLLRGRLQKKSSPVTGDKFFKTMEKHLNRLLEIQQETDKIIRSHQELEDGFLYDERNRHSPISFEPISIFPFVEQMIEKIKERASHRNLQFQIEGAKGLDVDMTPRILEDTLEGLLKNAIENTPDEGLIRILLEQKDHRLFLKVQDFGIGITEENQKYLFDGLFHTQETDLYSSKKPYDFNAGGKGLDLLRMKVYGQRFGFDLSMESRRCTYLPTDRNLCPGRISACSHCKKLEDCLTSGGSTFSVSFPIAGRERSEKI
jgi:signal transduction histidine kinase